MYHQIPGISNVFFQTLEKLKRKFSSMTIVKVYSECFELYAGCGRYERGKISQYFNTFQYKGYPYVLLMSGNSMNSVLMDNLFCIKLALYFAIDHFKPSLYTSQSMFRKYKQE